MKTLVCLCRGSGRISMENIVTVLDFKQKVYHFSLKMLALLNISCKSLISMCGSSPVKEPSYNDNQPHYNAADCRSYFLKSTGCI